MCVLLSPRRSFSPSFSLPFALHLFPLWPFLSLSSSSDSNKAGKLWGCITDLDMTIVTILPCLPSLLSVRHFLKRPVPKLMSLIYLSSMAVNDTIVFFLLFFLFLVTIWRRFFPPFYSSVAAASMAGQNVPLLKPGPNFYTQNVFLSFFMCLYLCEITSCNIWLWECSRFF